MNFAKDNFREEIQAKLKCFDDIKNKEKPLFLEKILIEMAKRGHSWAENDMKVKNFRNHFKSKETLFFALLKLNV